MFLPLSLICPFACIDHSSTHFCLVNFFIAQKCIVYKPKKGKEKKGESVARGRGVRGKKKLKKKKKREEKNENRRRQVESFRRPSFDFVFFFLFFSALFSIHKNKPNKKVARFSFHRPAPLFFFLFRRAVPRCERDRGKRGKRGSKGSISALFYLLPQRERKRAAREKEARTTLAVPIECPIQSTESK